MRSDETQSKQVDWWTLQVCMEPFTGTSQFWFAIVFILCQWRHYYDTWLDTGKVKCVGDKVAIMHQIRNLSKQTHVVTYEDIAEWMTPQYYNHYSQQYTTILGQTMMNIVVQLLNTILLHYCVCEVCVPSNSATSRLSRRVRGHRRFWRSFGSERQ